MIRQPSPFSRLYAWHTAALAGLRPTVHDGFPECGWFKRKMVKGGPWVPVRILVDREIDPQTMELTRDERLRIEIEGVDAGDPATHWTYLKPISRQEYDRLMQARVHDPRMADTRSPIDLSTSPTPPKGYF